MKLLLCLGLYLFSRHQKKSRFDILRRSFTEEISWETTEELSCNEPKTMVFKSLNDLAVQYVYKLVTKYIACSTSNLWDTETDLRLPMKIPSYEV